MRIRPSSKYASCPGCGCAMEIGSPCRNCGRSGSHRFGMMLLALLLMGSLAAAVYARRERFVTLWQRVQEPTLEISSPAEPETTASNPASPVPAPADPPAPAAEDPERPAKMAAEPPTAEKGEPKATALPIAMTNPLARSPLPPMAAPSPGFHPPPSALGIEVKEIGTGKGIDTRWKTEWGSSSKDSYRTKGLELTVKNVSSYPAQDVQAMACWLGKRLKDNGVFVSHAETMTFDVEKTATVQKRFFCPVLLSNTTKYVLLHETEVSGSKFYGWAVLIVKDGTVLEGRGSGPEINEMIRQEKPMSALLAAYQPDGRQATETMPHWRKELVRPTPVSTGSALR